MYAWYARQQTYSERFEVMKNDSQLLVTKTSQGKG